MHKFQNRLTAVTQKGFTLIELVIVIVIIGILAAVAIPNFTNVSDDAKKSVANGIAGAWASAASTNFAACQGNLSSCSTVTAACDINFLNAMVPGSGASSAQGTAPNCTVTKDGATSATALIKGAQ